MLYQQFTGINSVTFYAPSLFQRLGFESASAALFPMIAVGVVELAVTVVSIALVDRWGRRPLFACARNWAVLDSPLIQQLSVVGAHNFQAAMQDGFAGVEL